MTTRNSPDELIRRLSTSPRRRLAGDVEPVVEPATLLLLIPDAAGQQILEIEASRAHNGSVQFCRMRIVLTVGDDARAAIEIDGGGDYDEPVARVELSEARLTVGHTTLYLHGNKRLYLEQISTFLRGKPWIELVGSAADSPPEAKT